MFRKNNVRINLPQNIDYGGEGLAACLFNPLTLAGKPG